MARETLSTLLDRLEPRLRDAFLAAVQEIVGKAQIGRIVEALERGDVQGAIDALYIEPAAFEVFQRELEAAYGEGGNVTVGEIGQAVDAQGNRLVIRFDVRNLRAERWLRENSSNLITRIVEEQRDVVRTHLTSGMERGDNPRTVALDITGRINPATKRREGGVVGLSGPQEAYVRNAREELRNGDFAAFRERQRRDKRFDKLLSRMEREGKPLNETQITKIINRYADSLLKLRGETIARTEGLASLHAAQYEALRQLVDSGKVRADQVKRVWDATGDRKTRRAHAIADGQTVGLEEDFTVGGRSMRYPGDPRGGPQNVINCRCAIRPKVDWLAGIE